MTTDLPSRERAADVAEPSDCAAAIAREALGSESTP